MSGSGRRRRGRGGTPALRSPPPAPADTPPSGPPEPSPTRRTAVALVVAGSPLVAWGVLAAFGPFSLTSVRCSDRARRRDPAAQCYGWPGWVAVLGVAASFATMYLWDRLTRERR